jgi:hypothetical protein
MTVFEVTQLSRVVAATVVDVPELIDSKYVISHLFKFDVKLVLGADVSVDRTG